MSGKHVGTYQYWKPNRRWTYAQWSAAAFRIALCLALGTVLYAAVTTVVLVAQELSHR